MLYNVVKQELPARSLSPCGLTFFSAVFLGRRAARLTAGANRWYTVSYTGSGSCSSVSPRLNSPDQEARDTVVVQGQNRRWRFICHCGARVKLSELYYKHPGC